MSFRFVIPWEQLSWIREGHVILFSAVPECRAQASTKKTCILIQRQIYIYIERDMILDNHLITILDNHLYFGRLSLCSFHLKFSNLPRSNNLAMEPPRSKVSGEATMTTEMPMEALDPGGQGPSGWQEPVA